MCKWPLASCIFEIEGVAAEGSCRRKFCTLEILRSEGRLVFDRQCTRLHAIDFIRTMFLCFRLLLNLLFIYGDTFDWLQEERSLCFHNKVFIVVLLQTNGFVFWLDYCRVVLVERFGVPKRVVRLSVTWTVTFFSTNLKSIVLCLELVLLVATGQFFIWGILLLLCGCNLFQFQWLRFDVVLSYAIKIRML
jgi:hypothetical protein